MPAQMKRYRARFYNDIINNRGQHFMPCQRTVDIKSNGSIAQVVEAAKKLFAEQERVSAWEFRAQRLELTEVQGEKEAPVTLPGHLSTASISSCLAHPA